MSSHCSVTLKRHHSQDNFYKRKYLTAGLLTFSEFIIIMVRSMVAEILIADKNGAGEVLQSYTLIHRPRESLHLLCSFETSEPMVSDTLPLTRTPTIPPNLYKVIKAFYSLVIKHSNI